MSKLLHLSDFKPQLKKIFQVHRESAGIVKLTLVEVTGRDREGIESFSLIFKGPKEPALPQMTYKIKQTKLGEFRLFLVPVVSGEQNAVLYQAIINRRTGKK